MNRPHRHVIIVAMALLVLVAVAATTLLVAGADEGTSSGRLRWLGPIATIAVLVGAAAFLGTARHDASGTSRGALCESCGHEVLGHWRMCPYCGTMLMGPVAGTTTQD